MQTPYFGVNKKGAKVQMEIKYLPALQEQEYKPIAFNFEEIKTWLQESTEKFKGLKYTDDAIQEAKKDRATLNKVKAAFDSERKKVKAVCLKPVEQFEAQMKELVCLVDNVALEIDTQVKAYETKKQTEKREEITSFYLNNVGDLANLVPLEKIFNQKWLNVTVSMKNIETEISEFLAKVQFDLATINDLKSEFELNIKDTYLKTFDISSALREKTRLEERKASLEEKAIQEAQAKQQTISMVLAQAVQPTSKEILPVQPMPEQSPVAILEKPETRIVKFWVEGTQEQFDDLKQFLLNNGIKFGSVK